ncbi:hypothetical protein ABK040_009786 [Willaertia magna]
MAISKLNTEIKKRTTKVDRTTTLHSNLLQRFVSFTKEIETLPTLLQTPIPNEFQQHLVICHNILEKINRNIQYLQHFITLLIGNYSQCKPYMKNLDKHLQPAINRVEQLISLYKAYCNLITSQITTTQ